jgi:hypothetical protein
MKKCYGGDPFAYDFEAALAEPAPVRRAPFVVPSGWTGGDPIPGDKADIWALWVKQGRKGASALIAKYGATPEENRIAAEKLRLLPKQTIVDSGLPP